MNVVPLRQPAPSTETVDSTVYVRIAAEWAGIPTHELPGFWDKLSAEALIGVVHVLHAQGQRLCEERADWRARARTVQAHLPPTPHLRVI